MTNLPEQTKSEKSAALLKQREGLFLVEIMLYESQYEDTELQKFFYYWSESNRSNTKMKFELEKTWDLSRRLARWFNNKKSWNGTNQQNNNATARIGTSAARMEAARKW